MTPNKKNIRKWVKALRSGKYRKATGQLRSGETFCCLGVACDISGLAKWTDGYYQIYDGSTGVLPDSVQEWLGVESPTPILLERGNEAWDAVELNDGDGPSKYGFKRIADLIEAKYLT